MPASKMTISHYARAAGVGVETVRFYQREGLLPIPLTQSKSYRIYNDYQLQQLRFIRCAQTAGFSLREIKQLMQLDSIKERRQIQRITQQRLEKLTQKITELQTIATALKRVLTECYRAKPQASCPIIETMLTATE
jgi:DNA-binding transcriptional MerR regulator